MAQQTRTPLSREWILRTALALADEGGVEALSMRKLGQRLGFEAMSLYNHVANKDDVLDGILDLVLEETEPPHPDGDWAAAVRRSGLSVHHALQGHPWAGPLLMSGRFRPARVRYMDSLLGRLRCAGFDADTAYHVYHVLDGHIFGFSLWQNHYASMSSEKMSQFADVFEQLIPRDVYPHLREHVEQHFAEGPHRDVDAFEVGIDLILDGLKNLQPVVR